MSLLHKNGASHRSALLIAVWLVVVACGSGALLRYEKTPGENIHASTNWPAGSRVMHARDRPTLVLFAHPKCPCTRATLSELGLLVANVAGKVNVSVVFIAAPGAAHDWVDTDLWRSAQHIPGVHCLRDVDGIETLRFGAKTSGSSLLYSKNGTLLFRGGITDGRGHAGDNAGRAAIASLIRGEPAAVTTTPVFGCPLFAAR